MSVFPFFLKKKNVFFSKYVNSEMLNCVYMQSQGENVDDETLHDMLNEVDLNKNGQVELGEYILVIFLDITQS